MSSVFMFDAMIVFGALSILLLIGLFFRARLNFFQKFFVPACIIAGILGLILRTTAVGLGWISPGAEFLETSVYHIFNITFISLGLTVAVKNKTSDKNNFRNVSIMGLLIASVAALQFTIGGVIVFILNKLGYNLFETFGFMVAMGFEEGPGQALSIGKTMETFGFADAATIGLSFATMGFIFAIFIGVPIVGRAIKKGKIEIVGGKISEPFLTGFFSRGKQKEIAGMHTTHPAALDCLSFHVALVGAVYFLTYLFVRFLDFITPVGLSDISEMYWGFFFVWGLIIAILVRIFIQKIGIDFLLDREIQGRITGLGVDYLVVAAITAISLRVVLDYAFPILTIGVITGVATLIWVFYFGKILWKDYWFERTAGVYGMETGTVATGLMLIRIVDPEFKTPAATDLALSSFIAFPLMIPMIMFLMWAPIRLGWTLEMTVMIFLIYLAVLMILMVFIASRQGKKETK